MVMCSLTEATALRPPTSEYIIINNLNQTRNGKGFFLTFDFDFLVVEGTRKSVMREHIFFIKVFLLLDERSEKKKTQKKKICYYGYHRLGVVLYYYL